MTDPELDPQGFARAFTDFVRKMSALAPSKEPELRVRIRDHFGTDPATLPVVAETPALHDHANLHLAVEEWLSRSNATWELLGISTQHSDSPRLAKVVSTRAGAYFEPGPVSYESITTGDDRTIACVHTGLYLVKRGEERLALLLAAPRRSWGESLTVEVMAAEREVAEAVLADVRTTMRRRNIYRGRIVSLEATREDVNVKFHRLPPVTSESIILPPGLLDRIERQAIRFAELSAPLRAMGRHLKRGMLLHGPPGTGKTLTAMYLAARMPARTVLLLTGRTVGLIEQSCAMARLLEPATVILEDVDLIAEERTRQNVGCNVVLFELLNQMDGLGDDADVLFLLTTNRPDLLEPALASRPGRIDLAVEVPLPDDHCRRRLFDLYRKGLEWAVRDEDRFVARTQGVSAAFIRELLRKAALFAADERATAVTDAHLDAALRELAVEGGALTKTLLGAGTAAS